MRFFLVLLLAFGGVPALSFSESADCTKILAIRQMDAEEANGEHPVKIRGVVTYYEPAWFLGFVQDDTAGIYVACWNAKLHAGDLVEVEGVTSAGSVGRIVVAGKGRSVPLHLIGKAELPEPAAVTLEQLCEPAFDAQWVSVHASVERVMLDGDRAALELVHGNTHLRAVIPGIATREDLPIHLAGFEIEARGVLGAQAKPDRAGISTVLYIPSVAQIVIDPAAFARRFESKPPLHYESLFTEARMEHREPSRVQGRVTLAREGRGFFLNLYDGDRVHGTVYVQSAQPGSLQPGDVVDAVGTVAKVNGKQVLQDAVFRVLSYGPAPGALHVPDSEVVKGDYHGHLIWTRGDVVESLPGLAENTWLIRTGFGYVHARLIHDGADPVPPLVEPGTKVGITGILLKNVALPFARADVASSATYQIQLRNASDFVVLHSPPWWTVGRIAVALAIAAGIAATALLWVLSLRRKVRDQTEIIRGQLEREAVSEERTRIARDLHDTLAQHFAGITIQLDAVAERMARSDENACELLETARIMAAHSMDQTRLAIWDLRSPTLAREGLPAALQEALQPMAEQRGVHLTVEFSGVLRRLGGRVESHVLRIAQEAATNALKHGGARLIRVALSFGERDLRVVIADDGCGFLPPAFDRLPVGHFGLRGMLERTKKLNARFALDSKPGAGATVTVLIPYPAPAVAADSWQSRAA